MKAFEKWWAGNQKLLTYFNATQGLNPEADARYVWKSLLRVIKKESEYVQLEKGRFYLVPVEFVEQELDENSKVDPAL